MKIYKCIKQSQLISEAQDKMYFKKNVSSDKGNMDNWSVFPKNEYYNTSSIFTAF